MTAGSSGSPNRRKPRRTQPRSTKAAGRPARRPAGDAGPLAPQLRFSPLEPEQVAGFVDLLAGAYPLFVSDRQKSVEGFLKAIAVGFPDLFVGPGPDGRLAGGYAFYPLVATLRGRGFPAGGLGMVATALDRKKQHVALQIVRDFVRRNRERKMPLSFLYPFRHDFYADMGWGAVAECRQHRVLPRALPLYPERETVRWVRDADWEVLDRIHRRSIGAQGALGLSRHPRRWAAILAQSGETFLAGPEREPEGYLITRFVKHPGDEDRFRYDLEVTEMDWVTPRAMRALLGFLSSQRDQVLEVILDWPVDGALEAVLREPVRPQAPHQSNQMSFGAVTGLGAMLRLEDPQAAFEMRSCEGTGAVTLEVRTADPLEGGRAIRFEVGLRGEEAAGTRSRKAALETGLATLARIWAGAMKVSRAVEFGLATVEPTDAAEDLDRLLRVPAPWILEKF